VRLIDAGLVPKGSIVIQRLESKGIITRGNSEYVPPSNDDSGDDAPQILPVLPVLPVQPEPVDDDAIQRTTKLICRIWLMSNEECPEGANISVYRPVDWKFNNVVKDRRAIALSDDGTLSETQVHEGVKKTQNGTWKLKNNGTEVIIVIGGQTNTLEIATITDEVLVLS